VGFALLVHSVIVNTASSEHELLASVIRIDRYLCSRFRELL
jgi:hypothetical protein